MFKFLNEGLFYQSDNTMGFTRKKLVPPPLLLGIFIFLKLKSLISSQFYHAPSGIFHFFALTSLEILIFPSNFDTPLEFQLL